METKIKDLYKAPSTMVFEVRQEGVICASGDTEQFGEGESYGDLFFD